MPSGPPICALRASVRRTSDSDSIGWPTATASDGNRFPAADFAPTPNMTLNHAAALAGWTTPKTRDWKDTAGDIAPMEDGSPRFDQLPRRANLAGWPTARNADAEKNVRTLDGSLREIARKGCPQDLAQAAAITGSARLSDSGVLLTGSGAATSGGGPLNPEHSRWLQGLPPEWASCAPTEMPSSRKSRQNSSVRQPRP